MSTFGEVFESPYYTATVDHNSMAGQFSSQIIRSSSLRQTMRAARFNDRHPPEAEISVYRHFNGHDPKLVARRLVAQRYWRYLIWNAMPVDTTTW